MLFFHNPKGSFYHVILTAVAIVMVWRGIWNLLDEYMIMGHPLLNNLVSIVIGIILLYFLDRNLRKLA